MPDLKISQLPVATTPLAGTELVPIVQGGVTDRTTVAAFLSAGLPVSATTLSASGAVTLSGGTANGVLYLNGSKVATSGSALTFDGTNAGTTGTSSATKFIPTGGTATGNGMYLSAANTLGWSTNGTKQLELDASGNLGIGVAPTARLHAYSATAMKQITADGVGAIKTGINFASGGVTYGQIYFDNNSPYDMSVVQQYTTGSLIFGTNSTERARITSGGILGVGCDPTAIWPTAASSSGDNGVTTAETYTSISSNASILQYLNRNDGDGTITQYYRSGTAVGSVSVTSTATAYNTSSDYRLKDNPQPLTNSGAFIDALQPKTWEWKADGSRGVGFVAHEAQAVSPSSVVGQKDAVDADGKPVMQAMEYGSAEFIANIIAELQSLRARVAALEAQP